MPHDSRKFFDLFFQELERCSITFVILHSYEELPEKISPDEDIDFALPDWALRQLPAIQAATARSLGWILAQAIFHDFGCYSVLVNPQDPTQCLKLDACSSYTRVRRFLVSENVLLADRIPFRNFYIPQPAAEFIYELAKLFDAKNKSPAKYLPRLRELWSKDPATAQKHFDGMFGNTGRSLEKWFAAPPEEWSRLREVMLARNRFGPRLMLREAGRSLKRIVEPTGICIVILGSDGAGKSTLLPRLQALLGPCFRYQKLLHFRPAIFQKRSDGPATDPHREQPRNIGSSWLKVFYYFADWWAGWLLMIGPARVGSTLVVFDRGFD